MYRLFLTLCLLPAFVGCSQRSDTTETGSSTETEPANEVEPEDPFSQEIKSDPLLGLSPITGDERIRPEFNPGETLGTGSLEEDSSLLNPLGIAAKDAAIRREQGAPEGGAVKGDQVNRAIKALSGNPHLFPALPDIGVQVGSDREAAGEVQKLDVAIPDTKLRLSHEESEDGESRTGISIKQSF